MPTDTLPAFEGQDVTESTVKITRAGDGLSEALKLAPVALHRGERVFFVLEGEVDQINHRPVKSKRTKDWSDDDEEEDDAGPLTRVHVIVTTKITQVDESAVGDLLKAAAERIRVEKEKANGVQTLGDGLMAFHEAGDHASGLVEGCPGCDAEVELEAAGE